MSARWIAGICAIAIGVLSGCASSGGATLPGLFSNLDGTFKAYEGPELPNAELVRIGGFMVESVARDGASYESQRDGAAAVIKVKPGRYTVTYCAEAYKGGRTCGAANSEFAAGHRYAAHSYICYGLCYSTFHGATNYHTYAWFSDETTGQILDGRPPY